MIQSLITDGRQTLVLEGEAIARFACPFCKQYTIKLDTGLNEADGAICTECGCAFTPRKPYKDWKPGDLVEIWW
jgi:transcription elongation factor Elf1